MSAIVSTVSAKVWTPQPSVANRSSASASPEQADTARRTACCTGFSGRW